MRITTTMNSSSNEKLEGKIDVCTAVTKSVEGARLLRPRLFFFRQRVSYRESGASKSSLCDAFGSDERAAVAVRSSGEEAEGRGGRAAAGKIRQDAPL